MARIESVHGVQPKAAMRAGIPKVESEGMGILYDQIINGRFTYSVISPNMKLELTMPTAIVERFFLSSLVKL